VQLVAAFALTVVLRAGPDAGPSQASAEAELEALLAATTLKSPPAEVLVVVEGPDPKVYRLEEATVHLDGAPVAISTVADAGSSLATLSVTDAGSSLATLTVADAGLALATFTIADAGLPLAILPVLDAGPWPTGTQVSDGDHVISARLVYRGQPTGPYPWEKGPRWALPARVAFQASHGLRFTIRLVVETNAQAPAAQRLGLHSEVDPEMLVAVDDAPLPAPPLPRLPRPAVETPVAASVTPAAAAPASPPVTASAKRKPKKKVARATHTTGGVPASAAVSKGAGVVPAAADTHDALEEATARLRSALAAPGDAGAPPAGETPR
jgi:hypothetical protein